MKCYAIFVMIICLPVILYAELLIVDIEGNFDYTSIQTAVEAAVNGDTILVYPGEYIENVNYNGKSIVIGSLYLTTEEEEYIERTAYAKSYKGKKSLHFLRYSEILPTN